MNKQEIKYRANKRRARVLAKRRMILLLTTVLLITVGTIVFGSCFSLAQESDIAAKNQYKYYTNSMVAIGAASPLLTPVLVTLV